MASTIKCASAEFEPGWFEKTIRNAERTMRASQDKGHHSHLGVMLPMMTAADSEHLFSTLDRRFRSWTGISFKEYLAGDTA